MSLKYFLGCGRLENEISGNEVGSRRGSDLYNGVPSNVIQIHLIDSSFTELNHDSTQFVLLINGKAASSSEW